MNCCYSIDFARSGAASWLRRLVLVLLAVWAGAPAYALQGSLGAHDPSTIVKDGNKYWVFTTGAGIPSKYSTDLINWTTASRPVFTTATKPSWIAARVPSFVNDYWAPECFFMNGKFYLYYSCSTFGSKVSGIGLATNLTLDPASPSYNWVDEGEVISSNNNSAANAIDPAIYRDATGNVWFSYGSFFGGIRIMALSPTTGKPLNGTSTQQFAVAGGDVEASYMKQRGSFYYLFVNRGACCRGSNSTYYIVVGRSASPTGPFLDQNGVDLNVNGSGTLVLNVTGRYTGPGHTGIFEENGVAFFSHHYYDYEDNGTPKLGIARLTWNTNNWPVVDRDWVSPGRYTIATAAGTAGLVWQSQGCNGAAGQGITQGTRTAGTCQQWDFTALGDGDYKITSALGGLAAGVASCASTNSAPLQLGTYTNLSCQQFHIDQASDGSLIFAVVNGNRVVEVPFASVNPGTQLALYDYNGCTCQHWFLTSTVLAAAAGHQLPGVSIYPVPAERGSFTVDLGAVTSAEATTVLVSNLLGQPVFRQTYGAQQTRLPVAAALEPGTYLVQVRRGDAFTTQKQTVR